MLIMFSFYGALVIMMISMGFISVDEMAHYVRHRSISLPPKEEFIYDALFLLIGITLFFVWEFMTSYREWKRWIHVEKHRGAIHREISRMEFCLALIVPEFAMRILFLNTYESVTSFRSILIQIVLFIEYYCLYFAVCARKQTMAVHGTLTIVASLVGWLCMDLMDVLQSSIVTADVSLATWALYFCLVFTLISDTLLVLLILASTRIGPLKPVQVMGLVQQSFAWRRFMLNVGFMIVLVDSKQNIVYS
jgi:hypothetical protein